MRRLDNLILVLILVIPHRTLITENISINLTTIKHDKKQQARKSALVVRDGSASPSAPGRLQQRRSESALDIDDALSHGERAENKSVRGFGFCLCFYFYFHLWKNVDKWKHDIANLNSLAHVSLGRLTARRWTALDKSTRTQRLREL